MFVPGTESLVGSVSVTTAGTDVAHKHLIKKNYAETPVIFTLIVFTSLLPVNRIHDGFFMQIYYNSQHKSSV